MLINRERCFRGSVYRLSITSLMYFGPAVHTRAWTAGETGIGRASCGLLSLCIFRIMQVSYCTCRNKYLKSRSSCRNKKRSTHSDPLTWSNMLHVWPIKLHLSVSDRCELSRESPLHLHLYHVSSQLKCNSLRAFDLSLVNVLSREWYIQPSVSLGHCYHYT